MSDFRQLSTKDFNSETQTTRYRLRALFDDLHDKWLNGMDIKSYVEKSPKPTPHYVKKNTFFDDRLFELGCELIDAGKVDIYAWLAWMANTLIREDSQKIAIVSTTRFAADKTRGLFYEALNKHFGKPVIFTFDSSVYKMVNSI